MRLQVISDGTPEGLHVVNAKTGEELEGVIQAEWQQGDGGEPVVVLVLQGVVVDIQSHAPAPHSPFIGGG